MGPSVLHQLFQGLAPPEAGSTRMGPHAHAVVGHAVHADQALRQQTRHAAGELPVQPLRVLDPEVPQRVVVDSHPAAQPAVGVVAVAQSSTGDSTTNVAALAAPPAAPESANEDKQVASFMHHLMRSKRWFSAAHLRVVLLTMDATALTILGTLNATLLGLAHVTVRTGQCFLTLDAGLTALQL